MISSAFDLGEEISLRSLPYVIHSKLWNKHMPIGMDISFSKWKSIKYLNSTGTEYHDDIKLVPNDKGGLYLFYVKCPIITGITEYPFYIGRAQLTKGQNLRKRVKEYFAHSKNETERPKLTKMFKYWGTDLYLAFLELNDNESIVDLEKILINSLLLPMNDEIPDQEIREAVKAF